MAIEAKDVVLYRGVQYVVERIAGESDEFAYIMEFGGGNVDNKAEDVDSFLEHQQTRPLLKVKKALLTQVTDYAP
jgi:hypothetical protein